MANSVPLTREDGGARPLAASRSVIEPSRLSVYAALGATTALVPLPWVPDSLVRRVRGAVVHDVAVRHGLSLSRDARDVLAEPSGPDGPRSFLSDAVRFIGRRVARSVTAPVAFVWPARQALRTYTLGHLFDRYLELSRVERAVRVDVDEARRVRLAIDGALSRAITVVAPPAAEPTAVDDQRDAVTTLIDGLLGVTAGLPSRLVHRLDMAFDELLGHGRR